MVVRHDVAVSVRRHNRQIEAFGELDQLARRSAPLHAAAREPGSKALKWDAGEVRSEFNRISTHTGRHLHGVQNNAVFAELRTEILHHGNSGE